MTKLARNLHHRGWLRAGIGERRALPLLMVLTSYETFCELALAGASETEIIRTLQSSAHELLGDQSSDDQQR